MNVHKVSYLLKSDKKCKHCDRKLKINLVKKKPTAKLCYSCWTKVKINSKVDLR